MGLPEMEVCKREHGDAGRRHCTGCGVDICLECGEHIYRGGMAQITTADGKRMHARQRERLD